MFERFTDGARRATALASEEARQLGHDFIGTEHLLLGLLALGEGVAFDALAELEVTVEEARQKVTERVHPVTMSVTTSPPFTPLAKKSLERALRQALQLGNHHIGTEHLLLGLTDVPDGGGARVLAELSGDLSGVRQAVLSRLPPATGASSRRLPAAARPSTSRLNKPPRTLRSLLWTGRSGTPDEPAAPMAGTLPRCGGCGAPLAEQARYRLLAVAPGDPSDLAGPAPEPEPSAGPDPEPEPSAGPDSGPDWPGPAPGPEPSAGPATQPVVVTVVYCRQCGDTLGLA